MRDCCCAWIEGIAALVVVIDAFHFTTVNWQNLANLLSICFGALLVSPTVRTIFGGTRRTTALEICRLRRLRRFKFLDGAMLGPCFGQPPSVVIRGSLSLS